MNVGQYLISRLRHIGIDHIFGVPGDFALTLNRLICDTTEVKWIGTCNELNAAYAADGYARIKGAGAVVTTYAVGELSAMNGIAGSFTERVPVVLITGSPPRPAYQKRLPLHHTLGDYDIPRQMFEKITVANAYLNDPERAPAEIDRVLSAMLYHQRPVYLSIPSDIIYQPCGKAALEKQWRPRIQPATQPAALDEAVEEALKMLSSAKKPVILADVEVARYGLQAALRQLIEKSQLPFASLMMGKAVLDEEHPQFIGLYMGKNSREYVQRRVEEADCVLMLGFFVTDLNTGGFSMDIKQHGVISAQHDRVQIRAATYHQVFLGDFIHKLTEKIEPCDGSTLDIQPAKDHAFHRRNAAYHVKPDERIHLSRFFDRIAKFIPEGSIIVAETGNALFGAAETLMPKRASFLSQVFYGSIGFTLPAALGASVAAPDRPVLLFIGDGSFQVTAQELSTIVRQNANVTIFLINNFGYTIERLIVEGPYNDIVNWDYCALANTMGATSKGHLVRTERDLEEFLMRELQPRGAHGGEIWSGGLKFAEIQVEKMDCVETLAKAAASLRHNIEISLPKQVSLPKAEPLH